MEKIFTDFGVEPVLLAAQIVNFLILLLILKKFLYKPVLNVLEHRKQVVRDSFENAEKIEQRLNSIEDECVARLTVVAGEAQKIIDAASHTADDIIAKAHKKAQSDIEIMIDAAKQNLALEQSKMKQEMRDELAQLVIFGIEKTAGKILEHADHKRILNEQISNLKNTI